MPKPLQSRVPKFLEAGQLSLTDPSAGKLLQAGHLWQLVGATAFQSDHASPE